MKFTSRINAALAGAFMAVLTAATAHSADVKVTWEPPASNADGSPVTDLKGYRVYYGTSTGKYTSNVDAGTGTTATVSNLTGGETYYFTVTAYDSAGTESEYSNEVSEKIAVASTPTPTPTPDPTPAPAPAPTPTPTTPPVVGGVAKGDADGNGTITMADVLSVLQMVSGDGVFSQEMKMRADVWPLDSTGKPLGDGNVTIDDCLSVLRHVVKPATW